MPLKVTCPHCGHVFKLGQPYPMPGSELQCPCGRMLSLTFPPGLVDRLKAHGARLADDSTPSPSAGASSTSSTSARPRRRRSGV